MIRIGLAEAIAGYFFVLIAVALVVWLAASFRREKKRSGVNPTRLVRRCPYCAHVFLDYRETALIVCPVCQSYFEGGHDATPSE